MNKKKRKYTKRIKDSARPVDKPAKRSTKRVQLAKQVIYDLTPEWISLYLADENKPDLAELHSIIKFNLILIQKVTGISIDMSLNQIYKDIKDNVKDRQKFVLGADDWSDAGIRDFFQINVEHFKRYK